MGDTMKKTLITIGILLIIFIILAGVFFEFYGDEKIISYEEQLAIANKYIETGNYEEAIIAFTKLIDVEPNRTDAYLGRAKAYLGSGETEENLQFALLDYENVTKINGIIAEGYLGMADVYVRRGDYDKALEILKTGLEKTNMNKDIEYAITTLYSKFENLLQEYYNRNYSENSIGFMADVTNDNISELIVVKNINAGTAEETIEGYVFAVNDMEITCLETKVGGPSHMSGFFSWYITKEDNQYYLVEESHQMWQGYGQLQTNIYNFDGSGNKNKKNVISVKSYDTPVSEIQFDEYINNISSVIKNSYEIYSNATESVEKPMKLDQGDFVILGSNFKDDNKESKQSEDSQSFPYGKYKADVDFLTEGQYGFITLKENNKCYIETNFDCSSGNLITPIKSEGAYTIETVDEIFPDGTHGKINTMTFYINGKEFAVFGAPGKDGDSILFSNQWFNYVYIGN